MPTTTGLSPNDRVHACASCSKAFVRAEHLRRHALSHLQERPFHCTQCDKAFSRSDALRRHSANHQNSSSLCRRGERACLNCANAKTRCSGEAICARCNTRGVQCMYPDARNRNGEDDLMTSEHGEATTEQSRPFLSLTMERPTSPLNTFDTPIGSGRPLDRGQFTNWLDAMGDEDFTNLAFEAQPSFDDLFLLPDLMPSDVHNLPARLNHQSEYFLPSQQETATPESTFSGGSTAPAGASTSQLSSERTQIESGRYYADGEPGRLSRAKRRKIRHSGQAVESPCTQSATWKLAHPVPADQDLLRPLDLEQSVFEHAQHQFRFLCSARNAFWPAFQSDEFPSKPFLEHLVGLYFKYFDSTFPFLKLENIVQCPQDSTLLIAVAAIGSHFLEVSDATLIITGLREFTRRILVYAGERASDRKTIWHDCAQLLHFINAAYSGDDQLRARALESKTQLVRIMAHARKEFQTQDRMLQSFAHQHPQNSGPSEEGKWRRWHQREQALRVLHCAWLISAMSTYHFDEAASHGLQDNDSLLPCHEQLWHATSAEAWINVDPKYTHSSTLKDALRKIYVEKDLSPHVGEFARVVIIHGIFQRMSEVERYFGDPLSQWQPNAERHFANDILPQRSIWLPSIPTFVKWQNAACDALDVLHWQANATIGQASGVEHTTVLHLHFARIILLTPFNQIVALARFLAAPQKTQADKEKADAHRLLVQRWAVQHQFKARLAAIHAGTTFWHAKRFSVDAFYEAPAVAMAALVLWAFGTFASRDTSRQPSHGPVSLPSTSLETPGRAPASPHGDDTEQSDEGFCEIIHLDRPTDDELVQQFIRRGQSMKAYITGVGDLYAAGGPRRTLVQALKILRSLRCWSIGQQWHDFLSELVDVLHAPK